jgi:hypothetical protein
MKCYPNGKKAMGDITLKCEKSQDETSSYSNNIKIGRTRVSI